MTKAFWVLLALMIALPILGAGYLLTEFVFSTDNASSLQAANGGASTSTISLSEFESLHNGMPWDEVQRTVGSSGQLISETEMAGNHTAIYQFEGEGALGANASVVIQNGRLVQKSQFGLR